MTDTHRGTVAGAGGQARPGKPNGPGRVPRAAAAGLATAAAVLLGAAGCSGSPPAAAPHTAAAAVTVAAAQLPALAARYLTIARPANGELDHDFDGLKDNRNRDLAAAAADLRDAAATERRFDGQLIAIAFPPSAERIARLLFAVNQARASLTGTAAAATSWRQLSGYQRRLDEANRPVEDAVTVIRSQLGLPPPDTS